MRRAIGTLVLAGLLLAMTAAAGMAVNQIKTAAQEKNREKTAIVQQRVDETIALLEALARDKTICSKDSTLEEKARYLTALNQREELGYMMLRILDEDINIYKEGVGPAASLASRDYMQRLYATGELQVTDAFLAGADGETINYTVAVALKENGRVTGALMAAIYGAEIDADLQDDHSENILIGGEFQYMGGGGIQFFAYAPVEQTAWVILTEVQAIPQIWGILIAYACGAAVLACGAAVLAAQEKRKSGEAPETAE